MRRDGVPAPAQLRQHPNRCVTAGGGFGAVDTAPTSRVARTSLVDRTRRSGSCRFVLLHDSTSSSRRSAPPKWWTAPARAAPWAVRSRAGETDASLSSASRGTGAAAPRGRACRPASPGTPLQPDSKTASARRRCTSCCSTGVPGRSGCKGRTSAGRPAGRMSRISATPAPHTLHANFWRAAAARCTSRSTASAPCTRARRARGPLSSCWGALRFSGRAFRASGVVLHSPPTSFQSPPAPPQTPRPGHHARLDRIAGSSDDHDDDDDQARCRRDVDPPSRGAR